MRMRDFINRNRADIDLHIKSIVPNARIDEDERERWINNDESLYLWARAEGVNI